MLIVALVLITSPSMGQRAPSTIQVRNLQRHFQCSVKSLPTRQDFPPTVSLFLLVMVVISLSVSQFFMLCFVESQAYSQEHPVSDANFNSGDFLESRR